MSKIMYPWTVIQLLEANSSRNTKEVILANALQDKNLQSDLLQGFIACLNGFVTYGVKQIPTKKDSNGAGLPMADFMTLLSNMVADKNGQRQLSGHAARDAIEAAMNRALPEQWNDWYRRILIRDLRCGTTESTINKVIKKLNKENGLKLDLIPVYDCQLAHHADDHPKKMIGEKAIQSKLDGVRVNAWVYPENKQVILLSRNGKQFYNFPHIEEQLSAIAYTFAEPMLLDGEVMSGEFNDLMTQVNRKRNANAKDAVLNLFDMITAAEFNAGKGKKKQLDRTNQLKAWYEQVADTVPNIAVLEQEIVNLSTEAGRKRFKNINYAALEAGFEGIMVKDLDALYECKRVAHWLKMKPVIQVSLEIVAVEEGTGKNAGRLGAFVCKGEDEGRQIDANVGTGISDDQRDEFWKNRKKLIGQIIEVEADKISKNRDGTYSLRFPRFLRFRGFGAGEKL